MSRALIAGAARSLASLALALTLTFVAGAAAAADLTVTQTGGGAATAGQTRTFVITASSVSLGLPPGLAVTVTTTLVGATPASWSGSGWSCSPAGLVVTCTRSSGLTPGAAFPAITVTAVVGSGTSYSSCATVAHAVNPMVQPDQVSGNNTACVTGPIQPGTVALTVEKFNQSANCNHNGYANPCKFRIRIRNTGTAAYNGPVTFSDTVTFLFANNMTNTTTPAAPLPTGWACSASGPPVTCTGMVNLLPSQSVDVVLFLTVTQPTPPIKNCVRLTAPLTTQPFCLTM